MISKNTIWYQIIIDRFAGFKSADGDDQPKFIGGNMKGIIDKLDYLSDLGVDVLVLSPFTKSAAYHGYHVVDYELVDPHFGNWDDLKNLIHLARLKNIKIIADFVPNHCSEHHPYFIDSQHNKNSKYKYWFYYKNWPDNYLCFMHHSDLPKLNMNNPEAADYFLQIAITWCRMGIDGLRIDHVIGLPDNFIKRLSTILKSINPDFFLIGEAWMGGLKYKYLNTLGIRGKHQIWKSMNPQLAVQQHYESLLDGVYDFNKHYYIVSQLFNNENYKQVEESVSNFNHLYSDNYFLPVFLDNHDLNRYYFLCEQNKKKYIRTLNILINQKQPVLLYYGNEIPLTQKNVLTGNVPHSDLNVRQAMQWDISDKTFYDLVKNLIKDFKQFHGNS